MAASLDQILTVAALVLAALALLAFFAERRRRRLLVVAYERLGFERLPEGYLAPLMGPDRFWLLNRPAWWRAVELARGHWHGREVVQFRLTLPDAIGRSQHQTATLIRDAGELPAFHLRPETLRDRMGAALGDAGIDYPGLSRYTGALTTDGDGADTPGEVLPTELLEYLQRDSGWCLEARGGHLLVFQGHNLVRTPADIEWHLQQAAWMHARLLDIYGD
jgi:hypothetical protein